MRLLQHENLKALSAINTIFRKSINLNCDETYTNDVISSLRAQGNITNYQQAGLYSQYFLKTKTVVINM